ncbi:hypothetical protein X975_01078, partial [Stegodyphus mimosarum]
MSSSMWIAQNLSRLVCVVTAYLCILTNTAIASGVYSTISTDLKNTKQLICTNVKYAYSEKGFGNNEVPLQAIS